MRPYFLLIILSLPPFTGQAQEVFRMGKPFLENCPRIYSADFSDTIFIKYVTAECRISSFRYIKAWKEGDVVKAAYGYVYGNSPVFSRKIWNIDDWKQMDFPSPYFVETVVPDGWADSLLLAFDYVSPADSIGKFSLYDYCMLSQGDQHYRISGDGKYLVDELIKLLKAKHTEHPGMLSWYSYYEPLSSLEVLPPVWSQDKYYHDYYMFLASKYSLVYIDWDYENDSLMAKIGFVIGVPEEWSGLSVRDWIEVSDTFDFRHDTAVYMGPEFLPLLEAVRLNNIAPVNYDAASEWEKNGMISFMGGYRRGFAGVDWNSEALSGYYRLLLSELSEIFSGHPPVRFEVIYPDTGYKLRYKFQNHVSPGF